MKKVIRKVYIDYEKEERWLNDMCSKGYALTRYTWCRYEFEECEPGAYIYRLEMLESLPGTQESINYLNFLKEAGIEHISSYIRWVFLRKRSSDGPFDLFTDAESKIKHHMRIATFLSPLGLFNIFIGFNYFLHGSIFPPVLNLFLGGFVCYHALRHYLKAQKIKKNRVIYGE